MSFGIRHGDSVVSLAKFQSSNEFAQVERTVNLTWLISSIGINCLYCYCIQSESLIRRETDERALFVSSFLKIVVSGTMARTLATGRSSAVPSKGQSYQRSNPRRGGPAILFTCDQGRERKCEREGKEMLKYYWESQDEHKAQIGVGTKSSNLDDELATLRARTDEKSGPFRVFETGCRGTVVLMCALPNCNIIPRLTKERETSEPSAKKLRLDGKHLSMSPPWDPIRTVHAVVKDLVDSNESGARAPGSRFVSRMIPVQATCYASLTEIQEVVDLLLDRLLPTLAPLSAEQTPRSFGITFKRRNCSMLQRNTVIEAIAGLVVRRTSWSVKLREPDFTVMIEVCKTLCGISILPSSCQTVAPNFNIATLRAKDGASE